jgi:predicted glycoside hydrolase/deacetylase ChbG (UPF0249 family)
VERKVRLIVNADDLGASLAGNQTIFELIEQGAIRSASILPNGAALDDAIARASHWPNCSFGIHLNVTHGLPVGTGGKLTTILDDSGRFKRRPEFGRFSAGESVRRDILDEWRSQFKGLLASGVRVSHIDSHHHVHTYPSLFGVLRTIQREFGVRRVRLARTSPQDGSGVGRSIARSAWNALLRLDGAKTADHFCSLSDYRRLLQLRPFRRDVTIEVMVHPGLEAYADETNLLRGEWWISHLHENELISYDEL